MSEFAPISSSLKAKRTFNPIRNIVDNLRPPVNHELKNLNLALGDPTAHGNLHCPEVLVDAIQKALSSGNANGYLPSPGSQAARAAIAAYTSRPGHTLDADDVIIASGCSGAVELAISVLINEGDNILVPRPGFPLYEVITGSLGGNVQHYNLLPDKDWECDLSHMESLINDKTKAILINNPSNPCGNNFSSDHLRDIADVARRHGLPIIADEIYGGCVYDGVFTPMFTVCPDVPVLSLGGLAKEFIIPGWRVGWVVVQDKSKRLDEVRSGLKSLTQLILGACSLIQAAIPRVLTPATGSEDEASLNKFHEFYMTVLKSNANLCAELAKTSDVLTINVPKGAMYCMIGIDFSKLDGLVDDRDFAQKLLEQENLVLLPGQCFGMVNYIRIVTCPPAETLAEAFSRIASFCERHRKK